MKKSSDDYCIQKNKFGTGFHRYSAGIILMLAFSILFPEMLSANGNKLSISGSVPSQVTVCGAQVTFTVTVSNISASSVTNDTLFVNMPAGMNYVPGSVSGTGVTEQNISVPRSPVFLFPNLAPGAIVNIVFSAYADCDIIAYQAAGSPIVNDYSAHYSGNFDQGTTNPYNILIPALVISSVTNQSFNGTVGITFTRTITICSTGNGALNNIVLADQHGNGIQVAGVSAGALVSYPGADTIKLSGSDFTGTGNGNALLENGECIKITETVKILNCANVISLFTASWGCNGKICQAGSQANTSTANVIFPNGVPNLLFTPKQSAESCYDISVPRKQQLKIVNAGTGTALDVVIDIFQCTTLPFYDSGELSKIDVNSFTVKKGTVGVSAPLPSDSSYANAVYACLGTNPKGRAFVTIPKIAAGDTLYLEWNSYTCCQSSCSGNWLNFDGWAFQGHYSNECKNVNYTISSAWGGVYHYFSIDITQSYPSDLVNNQSGTFTWAWANNMVSVPLDPSATFQLVFTLPPCLKWGGNNAELTIYDPKGSPVSVPTLVTVNGNVITATYHAPIPPITQPYIALTLTADCSLPGCTGGGASTVNMEMHYNANPNAACNKCNAQVICKPVTVNVHCAAPCPEGMNFLGYNILRTSYGKPDNNEDGLADGTGVLNFNKIRTDRAMFGDTITGIFKGVVITSAAHPSWKYAYAATTISGAGSSLSNLGATAIVYDASSGITYNCPLLNTGGNMAGSSQAFSYDISSAALIASGGGVPPGFLYGNGDSVKVITRFKVTANLGGTIVISPVGNDFYTADIPNPTLASDKYACDNYSGNISIVGYYYTSYNVDNYFPVSCDTTTIFNSQYLSIGPCCQNYAGGNMFPYEYRYWAHVKRVRISLPKGYTYVSAIYVHSRTAGTGGITTETSPMNPVFASADSLVFDIESLFIPNGGTINYSDDGYYSSFYVKIAPSCETNNQVKESIDYLETHAQSAYLGGGTSTWVYNDFITYTPPALNIQSLLPTVDGINATVCWDLLVSNSANVSSAAFSWLNFQSLSGKINISSVTDASGNPVPQVGGIYQLGTMSASSQKKFKVCATYSTCTFDSILINGGWDCRGYPSSLAAYPCTPEKFTIYLDPKPPLLQMQIIGAPDSVKMCDTVTYAVKIRNVQIGTAYNIKLNVTLPLAGISIIPGSSQVIYPTKQLWAPIADPVNQSGSVYSWDLSTLIALINANGFPGVLDSTKNELSLKFKVGADCHYISGDVISFALTGISNCSQPLNNVFATTTPLLMQGIKPYSNKTTVTLRLDSIDQCLQKAVAHIKLVNLGPDPTSMYDHVYLTLPAGVYYVAGSFVAVHNAPLSPVPVQTILLGQAQLDWYIPAGISVNDSVSFDVTVSGSSLALCDSFVFSATAVYDMNMVCAMSGSNCSIKNFSGTTTFVAAVKKCPQFAPTQKDSLCAGMSVILTAPDSASAYLWAPGGQTTQSIVVSAANTYTVTLSGLHGCSKTLTHVVNLSPQPVANFSKPDSGCAPVCVSYTDLSNSNGGVITSWQWAFAGGSPAVSSTQNPQNICYNIPGNYSTSLIVTTQYGCKDTVKLPMIKVFPWPKADFCVMPEKAPATDPVFNFCNLWSPNPGVTHWQWDFGDGSTPDSVNLTPTHSYSSTVSNNDFYSYTVCLRVQNANGCWDSICKTVELIPEFEFYIPNTFTPNSDNLNELFYGKGRGIKEYSIWLFDRWGNEIWDCHAEDKNTNWDSDVSVPRQDGLSSHCKWDGKVVKGGTDMNGGSRQLVQEDVYIWKVKLRDIFDREHEYIGNVNVVR